MLGAAVSGARRRRGAPPANVPGQGPPGWGPPRHALVVFVGGHGSLITGTFQDMIRRLGLEGDQVVRFDYRWAAPILADGTASKMVSTRHAADTLQLLVESQARRQRPIYLVGHSKGGAVIAELIARWDRDPSMAVERVVGAALLDAPIAGGALGDLQGLGRVVVDLADDGGYDPMVCDADGACHDSREHLGRNAGVEVVAIRNPDALVTNFTDEPDGLRVYDLDDGGGAAWTRLANPLGLIRRIAEAHDSPLHSDRVAACLIDEMRAPGSCDR